MPVCGPARSTMEQLEPAQVKAEVKAEYMGDEDAISSLAGLCLPEPPRTSWEQVTAASAAEAQRRAEEDEGASLALARRLQEQEEGQEQGQRRSIRKRKRISEPGLGVAPAAVQQRTKPQRAVPPLAASVHRRVALETGTAAQRPAGGWSISSTGGPSEAGWLAR